MINNFIDEEDTLDEEENVMTKQNTHTMKERTVKDLVIENGQVPFPRNFAEDGNALSLVTKTQTALKRGGWASKARDEFARLALNHDYNNVINSCLSCFRNREDDE